MTDVRLSVNGQAVAANVEPRLHLADFLREHLHLTGTHVGCEHGVCGACTLLVDDVPVRSCITFAAQCEGRQVRSIEGLETDDLTTQLRAAFTAEHALQCGYCTPGMLVTARDILQRLPDADEARIRLELAGNLCRCTGYRGIVQAIARVAAARRRTLPPGPAALPVLVLPKIKTARFAKSRPVAAPSDDGDALVQKLHLAVPLADVWAAVQNPALLAQCVPGARLTDVQPGQIAGEFIASLGPIQSRFIGTAALTYDDATHAGTIAGQGQDQASGTRFSARAEFRVVPQSDGTLLTLAMTYELRGALAQFARRPVVKAFADEIATRVGHNLEARLRGEALTNQPQSLSALRLTAGVVRRWWRGLWR